MAEKFWVLTYSYDNELNSLLFDSKKSATNKLAQIKNGVAKEYGCDDCDEEELSDLVDDHLEYVITQEEVNRPNSVDFVKQAG